MFNARCSTFPIWTLNIEHSTLSVFAFMPDLLEFKEPVGVLRKEIEALSLMPRTPHQKGGDTKQKIYRNFGYARPEGYRKALRVMQLAEKFHRPIIVFIDTPAAYPGVESEERGVAEAIAFNLREMMMLEVPIVVLVCGEGGSGGALGIAIGDRVLMQEFSVYSVIPPEGCAAILWRDANRKVEAAEALKMTAPDMLALGLVDAIVPEPTGGAHNNADAATALVDQALSAALGEVAALSVDARLAARYEKFGKMGEERISFVDADALPFD